MSSCTLFVRNKTDEFIGQVFITHPSIPDKLVIVDYTRDAKVFASASSSNAKALTVKCDHPKFTGFTKFLGDRKKAAVIKFQKRVDGDGDSVENDILFILPPDAPDHLSETMCLLSSEISSRAKSTESVVVDTPVVLPPQQIQQQQQKPPPPKQQQKAPVTNNSSAGGSFLSNLLDRVQSDISSRASYVKPPLIKAEVRLAMEELQNRVRRTVLELEQDGSRFEVVFEPMEPEQRHLVHEVIDEFEGMVSISSGEDIDRHVVVYKKGHEPAEEETTGAVLTRAESRRKKKAATVSAPAPPTNFVKAHTVKRDRRSIEDYQIEKAKKKKAEGVEAEKDMS